MLFKIILLNKTGTNESETLETDNNLVLIDSNGAGKSRLGVWVEQQTQNQITEYRLLVVM